MHVFALQTPVAHLVMHAGVQVARGRRTALTGSAEREGFSWKFGVFWLVREEGALRIPGTAAAETQRMWARGRSRR